MMVIISRITVKCVAIILTILGSIGIELWFNKNKYRWEKGLENTTLSVANEVLLILSIVFFIATLICTVLTVYRGPGEPKETAIRKKYCSKQQLEKIKRIMEERIVDIEEMHMDKDSRLKRMDTISEMNSEITEMDVILREGGGGMPYEGVATRKSKGTNCYGPEEISRIYGVEGEFKGFCDYCEFPKPYRAGHCSYCHGCRLRMDHHCVFLGCCIGLFNYKSFVLLVIYGELALACSLGYWGLVVFNNRFIGHVRSLAGIYLLCILITILLLSQLFFVHILLILKNKTTREFLLEPLKAVPETAPEYERCPSIAYNRGVYKNVTTGMGPWWLWMIPTNYHDGDGFHYKPQRQDNV